MSLNVKLLRQVQKKILAEPAQFEMSQWFTNNTGWEIPNCGTAACIAGWTIAVSKKKKPSEFLNAADIQNTARKLLGLDFEDDEWALFSVSSWPLKYQNRFYRTQSLKMRARITVQRIDAYIKEHTKK